MTRRILVVDDMEFNRDHLRKVLEVEDYEIETACDGGMALEQLRTRPFHLVITDLRMPDMSGFELLSSSPGTDAGGRHRAHGLRRHDRRPAYHESRRR